MKRLATLFLLFFCCFTSAKASSQDIIRPPNVDDWRVVNVSVLDVRLSDLTVVYLGFQVQFQNPVETDEFILVTNRFRPLIFAKSDPRDDRKFQKAIVNFYTQKERQDILEKRYQEADAIIYQRWRVTVDQSTNQLVKNGDVDVWFLTSDGNWKLIKNEKVDIEPVSILRSKDFKQGILAGIRYSVGDSFQIIRAEPVFLIAALKKGDGQ